MKFVKSSKEIREKLNKKLELFKLELKKIEEDYQEQASNILKNEEGVGKLQKEFFSRIFDPGDEYLGMVKDNIERTKKKIMKFEVILRNLPDDKVEIELTVEELEEFGF